MDSQINTRNLRSCFGRFPTGVTVVTYRTVDGVRGATMNSFTSVSLEPPLLLISVARTSRTCAAIDAQPFTVNVLRSDQMELAMHFAGREKDGIRIEWDGLSDPLVTPNLADAVAVFQCKPWKQYDCGDHVLVIGEITSSVMRDGVPLVFSDGQFASVCKLMTDGTGAPDSNGRSIPAETGAASRSPADPNKSEHYAPPQTHITKEEI